MARQPSTSPDYRTSREILQCFLAHARARGCKAIGEASGGAQHRRAVYKGFCDAKLVMAEQYTRGMTFNNMAMMLPWLTKLTDEDRSLLGEDWWPYGMEANRMAVDAVENVRLRYDYCLNAKRC
jgi:hypothetical protein